MTMAGPHFSSQTEARSSRALAVIGLCIGVGMIVGGGYFMHRLHLDEFVLHPDPVDGVVLGNKAVRGKGTAYAAIVAFTDSTGRTVTFQDPIAIGGGSFAEGQRVKVFHDPERPDSAMVDRGSRNYVIPAICLAFAGFCFLGAGRRVTRKLP